MKTKNQLIAKAIEQIKEDLVSNDTTALAELLAFVPEDALQRFLPEFGALWDEARLPEDRPSNNFMSASESAIDEQAAMYDDKWED